ncbi:MAG: hypothetical protein PHO36_02820 [Parabacteroides sp.]|nr:hypothetical protein [Parabacteroides sp.]
MKRPNCWSKKVIMWKGVLIKLGRGNQTEYRRAPHPAAGEK